MTANVALVIVSHSPDIAKGTAAMVREMVGDDVHVAHCGGNTEGGLGTDVASIQGAIDSVWSTKGVAVLVDLGGAETNSEMAIELMGPEKAEKVVICQAPIVEGAVMAGAEAAGGSDLAAVRTAAEDYEA